MDLQTIKEKMNELAIGNKYMAECCGVTDHYLGQCLCGSKKMTRALEKKILGVIKSIQITPKSSFTSGIVQENKPSYPSLEELAEWYKQPKQEEEPKKKEEPKKEPKNKRCWCEPNVSSQLRNLCLNLVSMFGDTHLYQSFTVAGNKHCQIKIEIDEVEE